MRKIKYIVNPVAGDGSSKETIKVIHDRMLETCISYSISISGYEGEIESIARKAAQDDYTDVVAVGGDGSVLEAFNGIYDLDIALGIIPYGTGNDFARILNIENDLDDSLNRIILGQTKKVDVGKINDTHFLNIAGLGIDSSILEKTEKIKKHIKGPLAYLLSTFIVLATYKCEKIKIVIDGTEIIRECYLVAIGNGQYYGGGMRVTPNALLDNGLLEIVIIHKMPKIKFAMLFRKVFSGDHIHESVVENYQGKKIRIVASSEVKINVDGNLIGKGSCDISIEEKKQIMIV